MCDLCNCFPCLPACPNSDFDGIADECPECGEAVYLGEDVADINGSLHHIDCLEKLTLNELLSLFDVYPQSA